MDGSPSYQLFSSFFNKKLFNYIHRDKDFLLKHKPVLKVKYILENYILINSESDSYFPIIC